MNTLISKNDIRVGLKEAEGLVGPFGPRFSTAIIVYRHPDVMLRNIVIEKNFISDVSRGLIVGAGPTDSVRNVSVVNNISINSEIGFKLNGSDSGNTYIFAYNTAYNNNNNFAFAPIKGQVTIGNLSVSPKEQHVLRYGGAGVSHFDFNAFIPDGTFLIDANLPDPDTLYNNFSEWKLSTAGIDTNSFTALSPQFVSSNPSEPDDFKLLEASPVIDRVVESVTAIKDDFGSLLRPISGVTDVGAWER